MDEQATANSDSTLTDVLNTRVLMISSALFLGVLGVCLTFVPEEILEHYGGEPRQFTILLTKAAGALYLGFAILNWMARGNLIGGIYSRPVALGNFLHFFMIALVLLEEVLFEAVSVEIIIIAVCYATFAAIFGYIMFGGGQAGSSC